MAVPGCHPGAALVYSNRPDMEGVTEVFAPLLQVFLIITITYYKACTSSAWNK